MTWYEWIGFVVAAGLGIWWMDSAIEKILRGRERDWTGKEDFSELDPPTKSL